MKISQRIEEIFSHAVAMDQAGRLKNTIYAIDNRIFIMNYDGTVLLRFRLRKSEVAFHSPISFRANDYDSRQFHEENGKIVFVTENGGFVRKKSCGTPESTPEDIETMFSNYKETGTGVATISKDILALLDDSLSHIELSVKEGKLVIIQRNVYSGSIIEISRKESKGGLGIDKTNDSLPSNLDAIGIRTNDFTALFSFADLLEFRFDEGLSYIKVKSPDAKVDMTGILALCSYDELGTISECKPEREKDNGRWEISKNRRSESSSDSTSQRVRRERK